MYALCLLRYRTGLEEVLKHVDAHRAYLAQWREKGVLLVSGPFEPRFGGALLVRVPEDQEGRRTLEALRDNDPFVVEGVAQYEILPWKPTNGLDKLDSF